MTQGNRDGGAPGRRTGVTDTSGRRWAAGTVGELSASGLLHAAPSVLRDYIPNALRRPATMALIKRVHHRGHPASTFPKH